MKALVFVLLIICISACSIYEKPKSQAGMEQGFLNDSTFYSVIIWSDGTKDTSIVRCSPNETNDAMKMNMLGYAYSFLNDDAKKEYHEIQSNTKVVFIDSITGGK